MLSLMLRARLRNPDQASFCELVSPKPTQWGREDARGNIVKT
jgi:hypothetical protein